MPPDDQVRALPWDIEDIEAAAESIVRFTEGVTLEAYERSELVTAAVERKFEIIGEALSKLLKAAPDTAAQIPEIRQIIAFRNLLIHGYAVVQYERVFRIVQTSLPGLCRKVADLLRELGRS
jgi:uncharacterized protein with HEPN domain